MFDVDDERDPGGDERSRYLSRIEDREFRRTFTPGLRRLADAENVTADRAHLRGRTGPAATPIWSRIRNFYTT